MKLYKNYMKFIEKQVQERMSAPKKKEKLSDTKGFMTPKTKSKVESMLPKDDMDTIIDTIVEIRKLRNNLKEAGDNTDGRS